MPRANRKILYKTFEGSIWVLADGSRHANQTKLIPQFLLLEACPKRVSEESAGRNPILKAPDLPFKSPLGPSLHTIAKISKTGSKRNRFLERPSLSVSCVGCPVSPKKQLGSHGKVLLDSSGRLFDACHRTR